MHRRIYELMSLRSRNPHLFSVAVLLVASLVVMLITEKPTTSQSRLNPESKVNKAGSSKSSNPPRKIETSGLPRSDHATKNAATTRPNLATEPTLYVVGYAHLDTEWRWEYPQTIGEHLPKTMRNN
ncbi:MAG: hypothetical protein ACREBG_24435, partial [Pyrinomonadaceae bacterium]